MTTEIPEIPDSVRRALPDYLSSRMINEFVYCPRLFYYEQVQGVSSEYDSPNFRARSRAAPSVFLIGEDSPDEESAIPHWGSQTRMRDCVFLIGGSTLQIRKSRTTGAARECTGGEGRKHDGMELRARPHCSRIRRPPNRVGRCKV